MTAAVANGSSTVLAFVLLPALVTVLRPNEGKVSGVA
jgi:hypothetical protein